MAETLKRKREDAPPEQAEIPDGDAGPEPRAKPAAEVRAKFAQFWYYQDTVGSTQGPFYPVGALVILTG